MQTRKKETYKKRKKKKKKEKKRKNEVVSFINAIFLRTHAHAYEISKWVQFMPLQKQSTETTLIKKEREREIE